MSMLCLAEQMPSFDGVIYLFYFSVALAIEIGCYNFLPKTVLYYFKICNIVRFKVYIGPFFIFCNFI